MSKKMFRRAAAILMAGAMMASMGSSVMAEGSVEKATITKKITKEVNDYAPNTTFTFSITPGTCVEAGAGQDRIYAGPEGGAYFAEGVGTITSAPKDTDIGNTEVTAGTTEISVNPESFKTPGIYRYVVTETAGDYEGITYTPEEKYFDVYVGYEEDGAALGVYAYRFTAKDGTGKDDGIFINAYDVKNLTVTKKVAGNQGDKTKGFTFTLSVKGTDGEKYYVVDDKNNAQTISAENGSVTVTLADAKSATIYGLSATDTYTVTEDDYSADGYKTKIEDKETRTATGKISANKTITVTNTREATAPTGIVMDIAPYLLMVLAAVALAVVFLRRRNYAD